MKSIKRVVHLNQKDNQESDIASQDCQTEPTNQMCSSSPAGESIKTGQELPTPTQPGYTPGIVNLGTADILGRRILCCERLSCALEDALQLP